MTWFFTFITDEGSAVITSRPSCSCLFRFVPLHRKKGALPTLLPHLTHYVYLSHFVLYVSIIFVNFTDSEICFLFFPFQLQNSLSADVGLGGNVLINKSVLLFSQWGMAHIVFILRPAWTFEIRGGADNSLARPTSCCLRTKSSVVEKRGLFMCRITRLFLLHWVKEDFRRRAQF